MSRELEFRPKLLGFVCNWCCYGGADLCGVSRFQYPPFIRLIRVMCSGRVDLAHIFRAFSAGMDGVFVGGCHINDCHYVTNGNYDALAVVKVASKLLQRIGVTPERLRLEWVSAGEGIRFANIMNEFGSRTQKLGPLGSSEGVGADELGLRLKAVTRLIPFLRLALTERLSVPVRTEEEYNRFFGSTDFESLFEELVSDRLAQAKMLLLLEDGPASGRLLAERLLLSSSELSRHLRAASEQGLVGTDGRDGSYQLLRASGCVRQRRESVG